MIEQRGLDTDAQDAPEIEAEAEAEADALPEHLPLLHRLRQRLLGEALSSEHMEHTLLSKLIALPVFSSDAISSVAYATQEIVLVMGAAGLAAPRAGRIPITRCSFPA